MSDDGTDADGSGSAGDEADGTEPLDAAYDEQAGILPESRVQRAVTLALLVALVAALGGVVYVSVTPTETADPYTEFYVLGPDGNASGYPTNLTVGETGEFVVGITNHEHEAMEYTVVARLGDRRVANRSVRVGDERTWEDTVSFTARDPGEHRLRILLYKRGAVSGEPDDFLRLWVTVSESAA